MSIKHRFVKWWYRFWHGIEIMSLNGTMFPVLGDGTFVSVHRRGQFLDVTSHKGTPDSPAGMIRVTPYQPNHGLMVEFWDEEGRMCARTHCDYNMLYQMTNHRQEADVKSSR